MRKCIKTRFSPLQMVKNIFLKNMFLMVLKYAQMQQNAFLTSPNDKKRFFKNMFLMVWKYAQMHQNTFFTTPDGKKLVFKKHVSYGMEVCAHALKRIFNLSRR
jgi:hypothetical protein